MRSGGGRDLPSLGNIFGRMRHTPGDGEALVARLDALALRGEAGTAVDVILAHTDDSVGRCSNGSVCSSGYFVRGLVRAREIRLCVDGRWTRERWNILENLVPGLRDPGSGPTQVELLDALSVEDLYGVEILRVDVPPAPRPYPVPPPASGRDPVQYRVHVYTRGFMAANLAREAAQLPPFRC